MPYTSAEVQINEQTFRSLLTTEKEHWSRLRQYFNFNRELVENIAGEEVFGIGCFAGLLSFINCGNLYKYEEVVSFIEYEMNSNIYMRAIRKLDDYSKLSQKQLTAMFAYHMRRGILVEAFVDAVISHIEELRK